MKTNNTTQCTTIIQNNTKIKQYTHKKQQSHAQHTYIHKTKQATHKTPNILLIIYITTHMYIYKQNTIKQHKQKHE